MPQNVVAGGGGEGGGVMAQIGKQGGKEKATSFLEFSVKASGERILGLVGGPGRPIIRLSLDRWEVYLGQSKRPMSPPAGFDDGLRAQVLQLAGLTHHDAPLLHLEGAWKKLSLDMRSAKPKPISPAARDVGGSRWEVRELEIVPGLERKKCQKYEAFVSVPKIGSNNPIQEIVDPSREDTYFSVVRCAKHDDEEPDTYVGVFLHQPGGKVYRLMHAQDKPSDVTGVPRFLFHVAGQRQTLKLLHLLLLRASPVLLDAGTNIDVLKAGGDASSPRWPPPSEEDLRNIRTKSTESLWAAESSASDRSS